MLDPESYFHEQGFQSLCERSKTFEVLQLKERNNKKLLKNCLLNKDTLVTLYEQLIVLKTSSLYEFQKIYSIKELVES